MGVGAAPRSPKGKILVMKDLQRVTGNRESQTVQVEPPLPILFH